MCAVITNSTPLPSSRAQTRHRGLDLQSLENEGQTPCSGDSGCYSAMTLKGGGIVHFGEVSLPASKSESNRALMIAAYGGFSPEVANLSDSQDTKVLQEALMFCREWKSITIADCGTAARFMTTYLACHDGDWLLTGTDRMKQRPIKPLVDALRQLGTNIQYAENEGFLPLIIHGRFIQGGKVLLDVSQSSQFASSLLLAAPMWPDGLQLELRGNLNSVPYLDMTIAMMRHFSAQVERKGNVVAVRPKPYQPNGFTVEADWSAASYWYEMAAFSEDCEIRLVGLGGISTLRQAQGSGVASFQGDSIIAEWMKPLGVGTFCEGDDIVLRKIPFEKRPLHFDFFDHPDLYPTMVAVCAGLNVEATFTGLDNLSLKESDRVEAMQMELAKIDSRPIRFCAHNDHRIVMALAPLAMLVGPVAFDHPEVVAKSYPNYWSDAAFFCVLGAKFPILLEKHSRIFKKIRTFAAILYELS